MAFMNARKRNKTMTYVIVAFVSVGLLLSVSMYWMGGSSTPYTGSSIESAAVQDFTEGSDLLQKGKTEAANKKFNEAIKGFEEVLKTDPQNVQSMGDMATSYFYMGQTDKAIEVARQALEINPNFSTARMNLAVYLYNGKKNAQEAVAELKKIQKSDPNYQQAQDMIAQFSTSALSPSGNALSPQDNAAQNTPPPTDGNGSLPNQNGTSTDPQGGASTPVQDDTAAPQSNTP